MNILKDYWEQNKKGYLISLVVAIIGGLFILLAMHTFNSLNALIVIIACPIILFVLSFLLFIFLSLGKKNN